MKPQSELEELLMARLIPIRHPAKRDLILYGAGNCGRKVFKQLKKKGFRVLCFIDQNAKKIKQVLEVPCFDLKSRELKKIANTDTPIVLSVFNYQANTLEISRALHDMGFRSVITYGEIHEKLGLAPEYWIGSRKEIKKYKKRILKVFENLDDFKSKKLFYDHFRMRLQFKNGLHDFPDLDDQYMPLDFPLPDQIRLIDGGAFNGDTIRKIIKKNLKLDAVAAFEPDPTNFYKLVKSVRKHQKHIKDSILLPLGLSKKSGHAKFEAGLGLGSRVDVSGSTDVFLVKLDDSLRTFKPTYIKMDIEGSEVDAIQGAQQIIKKYHPFLAICLYHKPEHIWQIPLLVKKIYPKFKIYIRSHGFNGFETVLYASPL